MSTTPLGLRDRAILEVFYSCGMRRSELISLWVKDVDFDRGTVFIRCGKGSKDRYVPIGKRLSFGYASTSGPSGRSSSARAIPTTSSLSSVGTPICADWLGRKIRACLVRTGINKKGSCHLLRHSVATLMLEGGRGYPLCGRDARSRPTGDAQRYTRVSIDRLRTVHTNKPPGGGARCRHGRRTVLDASGRIARTSVFRSWRETSGPQ